MNATARTFAGAGALSAALAVGMGAFGAHVLRDVLTAHMLEVYRTAVLYHLVHSLGLLAVAFVCSSKPASGTARTAGWMMAAGLILFCGSLYLLALGGAKWLGAVTPLGGIALLLAWLFLAWAVMRN